MRISDEPLFARVRHRDHEPRLDVVGPFRGASGYDRHTRELVRHMVRLGAKVRLRELSGWSNPLPATMREAWFDALSTPVDARTALHFSMPTQVQPEPGRRNVNYTMFEADRIPSSWVAAAEGCDRIVVPTASSRAAWVESGVPASKLRVAPLGVNGAFFAEAGGALDLRVGDRPLAAYRHRFLSVADLTPRKNHLGLLRSWLRATTPEDDAVLVLKASAPSRAVRDDFAADVDAMLRGFGRGLDSAARVVFVFDLLSDVELRALYQASTHYLSMSLGEGWDLPMMEAAAAGCRLIAPRHSAYVSYLTDDDAELLPVRRVPAVFEGRTRREDAVWFAGLSWWRPDEDAAAEALRRIIEGRAVERRSPGARIASEYSWERAAKALLEAVTEGS
jgi:glycosyltransferase involved in cell wall biosynthesis